MANTRFDRFVSFLFVIIGVFLIVESQKFSQSAYGSNIGPDKFPTILGGILVLLSIVLFSKTFKYGKSNQTKLNLDYKRFFIVLITITLYALLLEPLGYVISTFLLLVVGFQTIEKGKLLYSVIFAALFSGIVFYLYVKILNGTLPAFPEWLV